MNIKYKSIGQRMVFKHQNWKVNNPDGNSRTVCSEGEPELSVDRVVSSRWLASPQQFSYNKGGRPMRDHRWTEALRKKNPRHLHGIKHMLQIKCVRQIGYQKIIVFQFKTSTRGHL